MKTHEFVQLALEAHPDYTPENYANTNVRGNAGVEIICPTCKGSYFRKPDEHLRGNKCPLCNDPVVMIKRSPRLKVIWV